MGFHIEHTEQYEDGKKRLKRVFSFVSHGKQVIKLLPILLN